MKKIALGSLVLLVMTASAFTYRGGNTAATSAQTAMITDGAYRDGLFVGRLTAKNGGPHRISMGRWVNRADQMNYAKGYEQAFQDATFVARGN